MFWDIVLVVLVAMVFYQVGRRRGERAILMMLERWGKGGDDDGR